MPSSHVPTPSAPTLHGFPPILGKAPRVLVLGSMPGAASLAARAYYAHPRNLFWPFMADCLGFAPSLPYPLRARRLVDSGIAVWDVLARCEREGSLDSAIRDETAAANDFDALFAAHPGIGSVLFNGAKAEASYRRLVLPGRAGDGRRLLRLPSTSPANASQRVEAKREAWRRALQEAGVAVTAGAGDPPPTSA
ncbi:DNA-deoxyinosine glycosylase [Marilutibacter aestuarii]|uniref:DNA-deoxyinosine glycosylase n=1 Tax=Marilutibacter aestuarii TaxID=1706195 RepID=A0A508AC68_9GAMM|nr:DNA-deoxyinosine glycosylase [Lysobacter aestuarii]TQD45428.1 DNA-deoxyinosine glycosylase [Lysobacter aestuarii]